MQQAASAGRSVAAQRMAPVLYAQAQKLQDAQVELPQWLKDAENLSKCDINARPSTDDSVESSEVSATTERPAKEHKISAVSYNLWIGSNMPMYSSAEAETKLRNMHDVNHRELPVAKFAARVADFLWPRCQDEIDEAMAKAKEMQATSRVYDGAEEEIYEPPEVPHVLPFTRWMRDSKEIRESFICTPETRYKPRLAWYNPNDGMVPSGWLTEGLLADMAYYKPFTGLREKHQKW
eukprot:jgi/Ulvmu1/7678/UM038_0109.1